MNIADNILRYHLRNVYFLCGTACGGKTTIAKALARKYGFALYHENDSYSRNKLIADSIHQPALTTTFSSWEEYFDRQYKEYHEWLAAGTLEQIPMILFELIKLSENQKVVADMHMPVDIAMRITDYHRIAFLIAEPDRVVRDYYQRPDHREIYDCIMSLKEPHKALDNCSKMLAYSTGLFWEEIRQNDVFHIVRDERSTVEDTLGQVERHFQLTE